MVTEGKKNSDWFTFRHHSVFIPNSRSPGRVRGLQSDSGTGPPCRQVDVSHASADSGPTGTWCLVPGLWSTLPALPGHHERGSEAGRSSLSFAVLCSTELDVTWQSGLWF